MDYTRLLNALPQAKAAYGDGTTAGPTSVGSWNVTPVTKFEPETTNFQAGFYKDTQTGQYRIGFAGSNDSEDWTRANANLATGNWTPEATDSIRFVGAALVQIRDEIRLENPRAEPKLSELLERLDATVGHSQGGAWVELNRAFWGSSAVNIDGPGVGALLNKPEFAALKAEMQKEFPDLASEAFTANDGSMQSYAFSKIGLTGEHVGSTVQATTDAKVVDFITDFPVPPLMGQQAAIGGLHTALTHRIDAIESQAKEGALAEMNGQIEDAFNNADQTAADIKAKYPNSEQVADANGDLPNTNEANTNTTTDLSKTQAQGGVSMFNAVMAASQHWGQMDDVQRAAVLGQMYMAGNQMSGGATSLGDGTNAALSGLNFINALEHGQTLQALQGGLQLTQAGLSMYTNSLADAANVMMEDMLSSSSVSAAESAAFDAAAESAAESAATANAVGEAVPYVSYAIAMANFADNPEQAANDRFFRSAA